MHLAELPLLTFAAGAFMHTGTGAVCIHVSLYPDAHRPRPRVQGAFVQIGTVESAVGVQKRLQEETQAVYLPQRVVGYRATSTASESRTSGSWTQGG